MATVQGPTTQLITTPHEPLPPESPPLTEDEILRQHGALIWNAYVAFATDAAYFAAICEAASLLELKRKLAAERKALRTMQPHADKG